MAQVTAAHILEQLSTLEPDDLRRVQRAVEAKLAAASMADAEEGFVRALLEAGLIAEIKRPDRRQSRARRLVPIQGKPLSETIIEDRR